MSTVPAILSSRGGSTENARVCQDLLTNLQSRRLRTDRSLLVICATTRICTRKARSAIARF